VAEDVGRDERGKDGNDDNDNENFDEGEGIPASLSNARTLYGFAL
jgi:hypothetical protein